MIYISVASGSTGNCHFLQKKDTKILIDAGLSCKKISESLHQHDIELADVNALFVSHEHTDHIKGAGILSRKFDIPIYATLGTWEGMEGKVGEIKEKNKRIIQNTDKIAVGDIEVTSIPIHHDANDPVAFKATDAKRMISIVTDLGKVTKSLFDFVKKSNVLVMESNHDVNMLEAGPYSYDLKRRVKSDYGHLSNDSAGDFLADVVRHCAHKVMLAHLSKQNNMPLIAYQSVKTILEENGIKIGRDLQLSVLKADSVSEIVKV